MTIAGYDIGSPQGTITPEQWATIDASGVRFVFLRCGNGNNAPDPLFATNLRNARAYAPRVTIGPYHVGFPLPPSPEHPKREPEKQAEAHFAQAGGLGARAGELPPVLDFEWPLPKDWAQWGVTSDSAAAWGRAYLARMQQLCGGRAPLIYTYPDFWSHVSLAGADAVAPYATYPLWLARYEVNVPGTLPPWGAPLFWQKSNGGGRLPSGAPVDEDVFIGDEAAFQWFVHGTTPRPTPAAVGGAVVALVTLVGAAIALALRKG